MSNCFCSCITYFFSEDEVTLNKCGMNKTFLIKMFLKPFQANLLSVIYPLKTSESCSSDTNGSYSWNESIGKVSVASHSFPFSFDSFMYITGHF